MCSTTLFLYLDPGTGSLLLYAVLGVCTTLLFLIKKFWYFIKAIFVGRNSKDISEKQYDIVFHSEGKRYFDVFLPIIDQFIVNGKKLVYVTPDENDPACKINDDNFEVICLKNEYKTIAFLNRIKANIIVSTTPHLDIYMWKKSKNVKRYVHIFHAPTSVDLYEKYALSFYDIIICATPKTIETQKYLDNKRNLKQKDYYIGGCSYYDAMRSSIDSLVRKTEKPTILYAPSWGSRSSLYTIGTTIIELLLNDFNVIFRPHPQSFISDKEVIESIKVKYSSNSHFCIDDKKNGLQSMKDSDLMISDFSGVVFDYYYLFNRPVLLASSNLNINGYEVEDIPEDLQFDIPATKSIVRELKESDLNNLITIVQDALNNQSAKRDKSELIPYFGQAGIEIYKILMDIKGNL